MSALFSRFGSFTRLRLRPFGLCRTTPPAAYLYTGPSKPIPRCSNPDLKKYKNLQKNFKRRLRASYSKFADLQDESLICGRDYVYSVGCEGIYRRDWRQKEAELLLDLEQCCPGGEDGGERGEWAVQRVRVSPSERHLAATMKSSHREQARCVVVKQADAATQKDLSKILFTLHNVFSFEWANDEVLFYTTQEGLRCSRVFCLDLNSPATIPRPVFEDTQPDVFVEVALSRDGRILTINSSSKTDSEVWLINVTTPTLEPLLVQRRLPGLMYHVEHWRDGLVILANTGPGQEYQVLKAPLSGPSLGSWVPVYTPCPEVTLKDMEVVGEHCVLTTREASGGLALTVVPLASPLGGFSLPLPLWACSCESRIPGPADPRHALQLLLSSPAHPQEHFSFQPMDRLLLSRPEREGTPPERGRGGEHVTKRLEVQSQDGTRVPVTLFHSVAAGCLQRAPLLLHVYGAYGRDLNMHFSPESRLLLDLGWVLAYCHIRGGGELGLSWHRQARMKGKRAGVEDLRACLLQLHARGISSPSRSAINASSAGAVPVGALCNTDPHLVRAVTLQAPFVDVLGTMMDGSRPLTVEEREEWGDPTADPQHRLAIASYCPLHNITPQCYPSMLLTAYSEDGRVSLDGVVQYAERVQQAVHTHFTALHGAECERAPRVVLNVQPGADHFGPNHFDLVLEETGRRSGGARTGESALQMAFLYTELGLDSPRRRS
ncbi:prolyl endopeptidase-like isoform X1 [Gadus macrocephalus]|uniref:prolyl endopeptidase-like isoform X1 n=2 Tax=Gadus macrocephalus TaxID=80720 RepID=UPI0028CB4ADA|nr:prolyl endopeptidase-like isoform X1 [Gadus macrocephalus]